MKNAPSRSPACGQPEPQLVEFRAAVAHDILALALLHNEELTTGLILQLGAEEFPLSLQLGLVSEPGIEATRLFHQGIRLLGEDIETEALDELAADYASIYLTHGLQASPYESVWIDEEGLAMQEPMFQIRAIYERHGLAAHNWRKRSDDHLVLQLQFVSHLFANGAEFDAAARFLDEHLLRWLPDFGARVASRCATPFYAGLCAFTAAYMDELRGLLAEIIGEPRPTVEEIDRRMKPVTVSTLPDPKYALGTAPSW